MSDLPTALHEAKLEIDRLKDRIRDLQSNIIYYEYAIKMLDPKHETRIWIDDMKAEGRIVP